MQAHKHILYVLLNDTLEFIASKARAKLLNLCHIIGVLKLFRTLRIGISRIGFNSFNLNLVVSVMVYDTRHL